MDNRFNIHLLFNIPKTLFLEKYNIPSLNNSVDHFDEWFKKFFPLYNRQFTEPLNETKVKNALRFQFRQQFIKHLKELLPTEISFTEPHNLQQHRNEAIRHANYHIYTCTDSDCIHLDKTKLKEKEKAKENTSQNNQLDYQYIHNYSNLLKEIITESYEEFPKTESEIWKQPNIDASIFYINAKHEATFKEKISTQLLDDLATKAEEFICANNQTKTNSK
jgi:hypothetical protein